MLPSFPAGISQLGIKGFCFRTAAVGLDFRIRHSLKALLSLIILCVIKDVTFNASSQFPGSLLFILAGSIFCFKYVFFFHKNTVRVPFTMTIMNYTVLSFCFLFFLVYAMSFVFFFFLLVYVCVHVWTCMIVRECIRISSPGTCDQPNPPKILSNATIFVQPAQHVPCVAHQTSLMAETLKLDFQRQPQQHSSLLLFWSFSVLFLWGKCVANWYGYRKWQMETKGSCLTYQTT